METFVTPYIKCPTCNNVMVDKNAELDRIDTPCPLCGASGECRRLWPSAFVHLWLETVETHPRKRPEHENMLAVMLCAMAEILMEDLLKNILHFQEAEYEHIDNLLDTHRGRGRQLSLFKALCGRSMKDVCASMNMGKFYDAWHNIAESRNKFVHGMPAGDLFKCFPSAEDLNTVRHSVLEAFRLAHNEFAAAAPSAGLRD